MSLSSQGPVQFTGLLKGLWRFSKGNVDQFFGSLVENAVHFPEGLPVENIQELTVLLIAVVNVSGDLVKKASPNLLKFVETMAEKFKILVQTDKDAVGEFLTEALRCVNFAEHNKIYIKWFTELILACGISIEGKPDMRAQLATFGTLQYSRETHKVTMTVE